MASKPMLFPLHHAASCEIWGRQQTQLLSLTLLPLERRGICCREASDSLCEEAESPAVLTQWLCSVQPGLWSLESPGLTLTSHSAHWWCPVQQIQDQVPEGSCVRYSPAHCTGF